MNRTDMPQTPMAPAVANPGQPGPMAPMLAIDYNQPSPTTSLDLPAALQGLLGMDSQQVNVNERAIGTIGSGGSGAMNPEAPMLDIYSQPTYAQGGMVGPQGMPVQPNMPMQPGMPMGGTSDVSPADIQQFAQQNPQQVQQIATELMQMMQTGEINMQQLNMAEQLASVAINNQALYPQMRQFAIQQGLVEAQDIPEQYDPGFIFTILLAAQSVKQMLGEGGMEAMQGMQAQPEMQNFADGGLVTPGSNAKDGGKVVGPGTGTSDSIPIRVSAGEYVIPAHIVQMKGKEFFDGLLDKYRKR